MHALFIVILDALEILRDIIIVWAIMSWLINFNVINLHNPVVRSIWNVLSAITAPVMRPIQKIVPSLGGVDISPIIAFLLIRFIEVLIADNMFRFV